MKRNILLVCLLVSSAHLFALLSPIVDSIPMSDGKKLAADVYIPAGMTQGPVILIQTPYNRQLYRASLPLQVGLNINSSNYIFVIVDWRGFYGSASAAVINPPGLGLDGYSTVEWIANQSWSNGKIGTWGASALGRVQFQTAETNPPHLACICPLVAGPQYTYFEYFPNGDLRTEYVEQLDALGFGLKTTLMANQLYDAAWQYIEPKNFYPDSIRVPCYMIGGWYDHTIKDMLAFFPALQTQSPLNVQQQHRLLMGPWKHTAVGLAQQGQLTYANAAHWSDSLALLYFDYHLRQQANNWDQSPAVQYYQMGDNTWQSSSSWPPTGPVNTTFYFQPDASLTTVLPAASTGSFTYNYDPNNPSPTYGGPTLRTDLVAGPYNQADTIENRNDIAVFTTDTLTTSVALRGNAVVHLKVASNRFDTDFDIRLTDVYPDGRSMILNDGVLRMRCLNGVAAADTAPIVPGNIYDCPITLPYTCNTFLPGHRIRVDVTSSNYPRFNRNMNTDGAEYPNKSLDTLVNPLVAANTVYANAVNASYIQLPLLGFVTGLKNENEILNDVQVFPNPAQGFVNVIFANNPSGNIMLCDVLGNKVFTQQITGLNNTLSTTGISTGVYLLKMETDKGTALRKIVVQ